MKIVNAFLLVFVILFLGCDFMEEFIEPSEQFITRVSGNGAIVDIVDNDKTKDYIDLSVLVTDEKGISVGMCRVDWEIIKGEGQLACESTVTDKTSGKTLVSFFADNQEKGEIQVKATVFGSGKSVIFNLTVE